MRTLSLYILHFQHFEKNIPLYVSPNRQLNNFVRNTFEN